MEWIKLAEQYDQAEHLVHDLREAGFAAFVEQAPFRLGERLPVEILEGISVGCSVSVSTAVHVVQLAWDSIPNLKYLHLTSDARDYIPEQEHYTVLVGCTGDSMRRAHCREWSQDQVERLDPAMSLPAFHRTIREMHPNPIDNQIQTPVQFIGGTQDGLMVNMPGPPRQCPKTWRVDSPNSEAREVYLLREIDGTLEYDLSRIERK